MRRCEIIIFQPRNTRTNFTQDLIKQCFVGPFGFGHLLHFGVGSIFSQLPTEGLLAVSHGGGGNAARAIAIAAQAKRKLIPYFSYDIDLDDDRDTDFDRASANDRPPPFH